MLTGTPPRRFDVVAGVRSNDWFQSIAPRSERVDGVRVSDRLTRACNKALRTVGVSRSTIGRVMYKEMIPMYLFSRRSRLAAGHLRESMEWSAKMTEKVNAVSEIEVSLWTTVMSPGLFTLTWTCVVEDLAQLVTLNDKALADDGYVSLSDEGAQYGADQAIDDRIVRLVHRDPDGAAAEPQYAGVVEAVLAPGRAVAGTELGVEIAQRAKAVTGCPTSFGSAVTGAYGSVSWVTLYESIEAVQQANEALAGDADFAQLLDAEAGAAYLAGASTQTLHRKVL
jgi:hypothetical protein